MESPSPPSIGNSEPEHKQRIIEKVKKEVVNPNRPTLINISVVRSSLRGAGLDVDEDGFIIDTENGEFVEPYAYDSSLFVEIESPVDDPLETYCCPETESNSIISPEEKAHLSDLHSIYTFDGEPHPIRDDMMSLYKLFQDAGCTFSIVCNWSDALDLLDEAKQSPIELNIEGNHDLFLNCFDCGFEGEPDEWLGECADEFRCPECSCQWNTFGLETCTECQTTHRWEDIDNGGGRFSEPNCPDCGAGVNHLEKETRYDKV